MAKYYVMSWKSHHVAALISDCNLLMSFYPRNMASHIYRKSVEQNINFLKGGLRR